MSQFKRSDKISFEKKSALKASASVLSRMCLSANVILNTLSGLNAGAMDALVSVPNAAGAMDALMGALVPGRWMRWCLSPMLLG